MIALAAVACAMLAIAGMVLTAAALAGAVPQRARRANAPSTGLLTKVVDNLGRTPRRTWLRVIVFVRRQ